MTILSRILFLILIIGAAACSRRSRVQPDKIVAVYPVFRDSSRAHYRGYVLENGAEVKYDKENLYVKAYLKDNLSRIDLYPKDHDTKRIAGLFFNQQTFKPLLLPVKTVPFNEFGYVKMSDGKVIMYGLWTSAFYDLTNNLITTKNKTNAETTF